MGSDLNAAIRAAEEALARFDRLWGKGACHPGEITNAAIESLRALLDALDAPDPLLAASRNALAVLTDLAESAAYWSDYDVPVGLVPRVDEAKARLAAALEGGQR